MKNQKRSTLGFYGFLFVFFLFSGYACQSPGTADKSSDQQDQEWISLLNGKDLKDWNIKIRGYELNENFGNTFRVEDGILKASYDEYDTFDDRFGHIFYKDTFSHYKLRVEYRFKGEQVKGGAEWAYRNNGVMFHAQSPESMEKDQSFPVSIEAQMLGGDDTGERPTGNVCTPETYIEMNGQRIDHHCIESDSKTYRGDQWVTMELVVFGDSLVHHIVEGDTVLSYSNLRKDKNDQTLSEGYIALQAESHPTEFRKIEILELPD
ncbi:MAG: 3-keto-disaccharide hydrolase [Bacteroidota bacterium]